eukprot:COSAG01_NODE_15861_length_1291_cov_1.748322_1_plen_46_part_10
MEIYPGLVGADINRHEQHGGKGDSLSSRLRSQMSMYVLRRPFEAIA